MKHSPTEAEANERMWREGMRANAGEAHKNEGTLPETYIKERCGRAEGLELEVEFGPTKHSPTEAEEIDRHLIANESNDKQKRTWGYKGQRIGETSNPGP